MPLDEYTTDTLTHGIFKIQILGLIKRYQTMIDDSTTLPADLKWLNEELEQLSEWLKDINSAGAMIDFNKIQTNVAQSTKILEVLSQDENKLKDFLLSSEEKLNTINTTFSDLEAFKGDQGIHGLKGDKGDQGIQGLKGDKGDQGVQGLKGDKGQDGTMTFENLTPEQKEFLKGQDGKDLTFDDLTPEQKESLKGQNGKDLTFDDLTSEQKESLKGSAGFDGNDGLDGVDGKTPTFTVAGSILTIEI